MGHRQQFVLPRAENTHAQLQYVQDLHKHKHSQVRYNTVFFAVTEVRCNGNVLTEPRCPSRAACVHPTTRSSPTFSRSPRRGADSRWMQRSITSLAMPRWTGSSAFTSGPPTSSSSSHSVGGGASAETGGVCSGGRCAGRRTVVGPSVT